MPGGGSKALSAKCARRSLRSASVDVTISRMITDRAGRSAPRRTSRIEVHHRPRSRDEPSAPPPRVDFRFCSQPYKQWLSRPVSEQVEANNALARLLGIRDDFYEQLLLMQGRRCSQARRSQATWRGSHRQRSTLSSRRWSGRHWRRGVARLDSISRAAAQTRRQRAGFCQAVTYGASIPAASCPN